MTEAGFIPGGHSRNTARSCGTAGAPQGSARTLVYRRLEPHVKAAVSSQQSAVSRIVLVLVLLLLLLLVPGVPRPLTHHSRLSLLPALLRRPPARARAGS